MRFFYFSPRVALSAWATLCADRARIEAPSSIHSQIVSQVSGMNGALRDALRIDGKSKCAIKIE